MTLLSFLRRRVWAETKCGKHYPESVGERRNKKPLRLTCSKSGCYIRRTHTNSNSFPGHASERPLERKTSPHKWDFRQEPNNLVSICCNRWGQKSYLLWASTPGQQTSLQRESWGLTIASTQATSFKICTVQYNSYVLQTAFPPWQNKLLLASIFSYFRIAHRQTGVPLVQNAEHSFPASKGHGERVAIASHTHRGAFLAGGFQSCLCGCLPLPAQLISTQRCVRPLN